jgi:hypothetical protein
MTPYGEYITQEDANLITMLSIQMNHAARAVRGDDHGVDQAYGIYPTSGASDNYAYSCHFADPSKAKCMGSLLTVITASSRLGQRLKKSCARR